MEDIDIISIIIVLVVITLIIRTHRMPICVEMIFGHPIGVFVLLLAILTGTFYRPLVGLSMAIVFLLINDAVHSGIIKNAMKNMIRRGDGFSDFDYEEISKQDSGEYVRILENRVLPNQTNCSDPIHRNLADAVETCNICDDCTGITYINGNFELRKGPDIVDAPTDTIATTWLKPLNPTIKANYIGLNIPGTNEDITRKLVPNCGEICNADAINREFQEKRIAFFGLPKDTPDMPIIKTAFEPAQPKPTSGGGEWKADETYMRVPENLDKCSVSYLLDADTRNEWVMDAYMNPTQQCRIEVIAQNPFNEFDGKPVSIIDAYGGEKSLYGPMSFREKSEPMN